MRIDFDWLKEVSESKQQYCLGINLICLSIPSFDTKVVKILIKHLAINLFGNLTCLLIALQKEITV